MSERLKTYTNLTFLVSAFLLFFIALPPPLWAKDFPQNPDGLFDPAAFEEWLAQQIEQQTPALKTETPSSPNDENTSFERKDYDLDQDVLDWISRVVKTQPGIDPDNMANELEQRGFAFTSPAIEASLTSAAPITELTFETGTRVTFSIEPELIEKLGEVIFFARPCKERNETSETNILAKRLSPCFIIESQLGLNFDGLVTMQVEMPDQPEHQIENTVLTVDHFSTGSHHNKDQIFHRMQLIDWRIKEKLSPNIIQSTPLGDLYDVATKTTGILSTATIYKLYQYDAPAKSCLHVFQNGAYAESKPWIDWRILSAKPKSRFERIPIFEVCGIEQLKRFYNQEKGQTRAIETSAIAKGFAKVWRGIMYSVLKFPYVNQRWESTFRTIRINIYDKAAKSTHCGGANFHAQYEPPEDRAGLQSRPVIDFYLHQPNGKTRNETCFPIYNQQPDYSQTLGHELAHVMIDYNRAYYIDRTRTHWPGQPDDLLRVLKAPLWLHEMIASWAVEQLDDARPEISVRIHYGLPTLIDGSGTLQGAQSLWLATQKREFNGVKGGYNLPLFFDFLLENAGGKRRASLSPVERDNALRTFLNSGLRNMNALCWQAITSKKPATERKHLCKSDWSSAYWSMHQLTKLPRRDMLARFAEQLLRCQIAAGADGTPDLYGNKKEELSKPDKNGFSAYHHKNFECKNGWLETLNRSHIKTETFGSTLTFLETSAKDVRELQILHPYKETKLLGHSKSGANVKYKRSFRPAQPAHLEQIVEFPISISQTSWKATPKNTPRDCNQSGGGIFQTLNGKNRFSCIGAHPYIYTLLGNEKAYAVLEQAYGSVFAHRFRLVDARPDLEEIGWEQEITGQKHNLTFEMDLWCIPDNQSPTIQVKGKDRNCQNIDLLVLISRTDGTTERRWVNVGEFVNQRNDYTTSTLVPATFKIDLGPEEKKLTIKDIYVALINSAKIEDYKGIAAYKKGSEWPLQVTQYGLSMRVTVDNRTPCEKGERLNVDGRCVCDAKSFIGAPADLLHSDWVPDHFTSKKGKKVCRMVPNCGLDEYWNKDAKGVGHCIPCKDGRRAFRTYFGDRIAPGGHGGCISCLAGAQVSDSLVPIWLNEKNQRVIMNSLSLKPIFARASCGCPHDIYGLGWTAKMDYKTALKQARCRFPCSVQSLTQITGLKVASAHVWDRNKCPVIDAKYSDAARCCKKCSSPTTSIPEYRATPPHRKSGLKTLRDEFVQCGTCEPHARFIVKVEGDPIHSYREHCIDERVRSGGFTAWPEHYFTLMKTKPYNSLRKCPKGSVRSNTAPFHCNCKGTDLKYPWREHCEYQCGKDERWDIEAQQCVCTGGAIFVGGACRCPQGQRKNDKGQCQAICTSSEKFINGKCYVPARIVTACCGVHGFNQGYFEGDGWQKKQYSPAPHCAKMNYEIALTRSNKLLDCSAIHKPFAIPHCPKGWSLREAKDRSSMTRYGALTTEICEQGKPSTGPVSCLYKGTDLISLYANPHYSRQGKINFCCRGNSPPVKEKSNGRYYCKP